MGRQLHHDSCTTTPTLPTADVRRLYKQFFDLRANYPVLVKNGNWTHQDFLPFSNGAPTERGVWSISKRGLLPLQNFTYNDTVWLIYTTVNTTTTYGGDCTTANGIGGPYRANTVVRNLLYPFENYTFGSTNNSFFYNDLAPYFGCIESTTLQPFDFNALVPTANWVAPTLPLPISPQDTMPESESTTAPRALTAPTSRSSSPI